MQGTIRGIAIGLAALTVAWFSAANAEARSLPRPSIEGTAVASAIAGGGDVAGEDLAPAKDGDDKDKDNGGDGNGPPDDPGANGNANPSAGAIGNDGTNNGGANNTGEGNSGGQNNRVKSTRAT